MNKRINMKQITQRVAENTGCSNRMVKRITSALFCEISDILGDGDRFMVSGFGQFSTQKHKGHPVQFGQAKGRRVIEDYLVVKFEPSDVLIDNIRKKSKKKKL